MGLCSKMWNTKMRRIILRVKHSKKLEIMRRQRGVFKNRRQGERMQFLVWCVDKFLRFERKSESIKIWKQSVAKKMIFLKIFLVVTTVTTGCKTELPLCGFGEELVCTKIMSRKSETACVRYNHNYSYNVNLNFLHHDKRKLMKGGRHVEFPSEFPHMVALAYYNPKDKKRSYTFKCGGSLISPKFVLTAAHCLVNMEKEKIAFVRLGVTVVPLDTETFDPSQDIGVKTFEAHHCFRATKKLNDIALIELDRSVRFSNTIKPICLYRHNNDPAGMVGIGWGQTQFDGSMSPLLQKANLSVVPTEACRDHYTRHSIGIKSTHICAGNDEKNTCQGDSGGPIQVDIYGTWYIVGVTAHGGDCGSRLPGIYTRVSSFLEWIEEIVWPYEL